MTVRFIPLDAMEEFPSGRLQDVLGWCEEAAGDIVPRLGLDRVDVVLGPLAQRWMIPGWDIAAQAHGVGRVSIHVDPICQGREHRPLKDQIRSILAHELHHVARLRSPGPHDTLGANLVLEGLAQCFEEEVGCPTPNYAMAVTGARLRRLAELAQDRWPASDYNHSRWFYGDPADPNWPWSGGYSLGYGIVRAHLVAEGITASAAVDRPVSAFEASLGSMVERLEL